MEAYYPPIGYTEYWCQRVPDVWHVGEFVEPFAIACLASFTKTHTHTHTSSLLTHPAFQSPVQENQVKLARASCQERTRQNSPNEPLGHN